MFLIAFEDGVISSDMVTNPSFILFFVFFNKLLIKNTIPLKTTPLNKTWRLSMVILLSFIMVLISFITGFNKKAKPNISLNEYETPNTVFITVLMMSNEFLIKFLTPSSGFVKSSSLILFNNESLFLSLIKSAIEVMIKRTISFSFNEKPEPLNSRSTGPINAPIPVPKVNKIPVFILRSFKASLNKFSFIKLLYCSSVNIIFILSNIFIT